MSQRGIASFFQKAPPTKATAAADAPAAAGSGGGRGAAAPAGVPAVSAARAPSRGAAVPAGASAASPRERIEVIDLDSFRVTVTALVPPAPRPAPLAPRPPPATPAAPLPPVGRPSPSEPAATPSGEGDGIDASPSLIPPSDPRRKALFVRAVCESATREQNAYAAVARKFAWLDDAQLRDADGRRPSHPAHDARTLLVPPADVAAQSASQKQYWAIKSKYRDVLLFFKVGKFYELYEEDAQIASELLQWRMTVSGVGHCRQVGCPESGVEAAVARLVAAGHRVGRVEQLESAAEAKARAAREGRPAAKACVARALTRVHTPATLTAGELEPATPAAAAASSGAASASQASQASAELRPEAQHLLALHEAGAGDDDEALFGTPGGGAAAGAADGHVFGFAFLDAAAGRLCVGSVRGGQPSGSGSAAGAGGAGSAGDACSALATLLAHVAPAEILLPRGRISEAARAVLKQQSFARRARLTWLTPGAEFPQELPAAADAARRWLATAAAARVDASDGAGPEQDGSGAEGGQRSPPRSGLSSSGILAGLPPALAAAAGRCPGALLAAGAVLRELQRNQAAGELAGAAAVEGFGVAGPALVRLDGQTLANLEVLENSEGGRRGSLLHFLDACVSAGGQRALRTWLCRPLRQPAAIAERQDVVEAFVRNPAAAERLRASLREAGDVERAVGRARAAVAPPPPALPASYAWACHTRRRAALAGALAAVRAASALLVATASDVAAEAGPGPGASGPAPCALLLRCVDVAYATPEALAELTAIEGELRAAGGSGGAGPSKGGGKKRKAAAAAADDDGDEDGGAGAGADAGPSPAAVAALSAQLSRFVAHAGRWAAMAEALSAVDVLAAFAAVASGAPGPTCRPIFVKRGATAGAAATPDAGPTPGSGSSGCSGGALLEMEGLWHPCAVPASAAGAAAGGTVVPNDLSLGGGPRGDDPRCILLSGPNMGGKSTLLRAVAVAALLAHVGAPVPARACTLSPVDAILSRLGARDRLAAGESTFLVECREAAAILRGATADSVVILDELGRGTSTTDGYAVASAVLAHLADRVNCRLLFATHLHGLSEQFAAHPGVALRHMAHARAGPAGIAFLYKLAEGACPRSFGMEVATLAGLSPQLIAAARAIAAAAEARLPRRLAGPAGPEGGAAAARRGARHAAALRGLLMALSEPGGVSESELARLWALAQAD